VIYRGSKHYGRTGIVSQVGNPRLTINFDDGRPGTFVDIKYARLLTTEQGNTDVSESSQDDWISQVSNNDDDSEDELNAMFHRRLALETATTAISGANNIADVERVIADQASRILQHATRILQRRRNNRDNYRQPILDKWGVTRFNQLWVFVTRRDSRLGLNHLPRVVGGP
jgi:hypothetical protein